MSEFATRTLDLYDRTIDVPVLNGDGVWAHRYQKYMRAVHDALDKKYVSVLVRSLHFRLQLRTLELHIFDNHKRDALIELYTFHFTYGDDGQTHITVHER
jgi:hypothetical protein